MCSHHPVCVTTFPSAQTKEPVLRPGKATFLHPTPDTLYGEGLPPHMQAITPSSPVPHDQQTEYWLSRQNQIYNIFPTLFLDEFNM